MLFTSKKITSFIVSLALFMEAVDTTVINTAIPAMSQSLHVHPVDLKIALISYLLSLAIFIPISGWVSDKYGIKKVFLSAIAFFTLSSIWCGFAHNLIELVIARTLQGIGGSMMLPVGRLILVRTFERHELVTTMSRVVMVAALGMMLGPLLGGFITHYLSWHWIFWVNVPVGILALILGVISLENTARKKMPRLDKLGFILFGLGLAGFTFGFSALSETAVPNTMAWFIIFTSVLFLLSYIWHSKQILHPIVKTELFQSRTFRISIIGNLFSRTGFGGVPFLLPLLMQISLGFSPQLSGMLLAPTALGVLLVKPFSIRLLRWMGYKRLLIYNTVLVGISLWAFMIIDEGTPNYVIACLTFMFGFLISLQYTGMNSLAYADIKHDDLGSATSIISTMQQLAQSFGVAVGALLLRFFTPAIFPGFHLTTHVFHQTFFAMGVFTFASIFIFVRLKQEDGSQMIKRDAKEALGVNAS
ncbi:MAG: MFS transporter [Gammaproteobacteria bacterium]|nr:MFS transporter [Gammaproteobacteria bacterium]